MQRSFYKTYAKRFLDTIGAILLLPPIAPAMLVLAIAIKLTSPGPVLFRQKRTGLHGKPFMMYKFRSMSADNDVHDATSENKTTRVGSLMRRTSLDELPQIINVLIGDMSFIGPRPWITEYHRHLTKRQKQRTSVRPGITGRAQSYGRNMLSIHDKIEHDLTYVKRISLVEDLRIVVQTLKTLGNKSIVEISKHGIHHELAELRAQWTTLQDDETGELTIGAEHATIETVLQDKKKALYTATVDSHILHFHIPYLKLLQEMGYEVHVATNGTAEIPHCDVRHTVSFARSPFKPDNLRAIGQLRKIIDHEQFDLIHTHTPMGSVVTRLAAKEARKRGTRVIYTAHGFHFYKGAPWHYWALFYPIEKYLARYTDVLITINHEDYDLAKRKFKTRVEYVPGVGIDPKKFDFPFTEADKLKLRKSLGLKKDDFVMIFPAELSKRKQQMWLVKALAQTLDENPNMHLLLPGKDSLKGKLHQLVEKLELQQNVHLLGYRTDIPKLLKISDLALSSARQEGLPVNLTEAMHVGLPIVALQCRGVGDVISDYKYGKIVRVKENFIENINSMKLRTPRVEPNYKRLTLRLALRAVLSKISDIYSSVEQDSLRAQYNLSIKKIANEK